MKSHHNSKSIPSNEQNTAEGSESGSNTSPKEIQQKLKELEVQEKSLNERSAAIDQMETELKGKQEAISKRETELNKKRLELDEQEIQAQNGFPKLFEEKYADFKSQLEERESLCQNEWKSIENEKEELRKQKLAIQQAEIERDSGYAEERAKLDEELHNKRKNQEKELESKRSETLKSIEQDAKKERSEKIAELETEIADKLASHEKLVQNEKEKIEQEKSDLQNVRAEVEKREEELEMNVRRIQSRTENLDKREENLDEEVEGRIEERKKSFDRQEADSKGYLAELRDSISASEALISNYELLKQNLDGKDPAEVLLNLNTYKKQILELREELNSRPSKLMQEDYDRKNAELEDLRDKNEELEKENTSLTNSAQDQLVLEEKIADLSDRNKRLSNRLEIADAENNHLMEDLKRLQASYERVQDRDDRIKDIESPYFQKDLNSASDIGELEWLDNINKSCIDYGLRFPQRILYAFHTALKTFEWSPITVLAGVSGTGKSELPRLYSHFGGINFLNLSVQPNWDSQESMLGFFNSIDNKFDAQPVLRLLAQSQKFESDDYPYGLRDFMSLVLLDEMNLAHIELYFAEFLSKLELRRASRGAIPNLEVKLGAGLEHYDLPLGRNVLWVGTMNQDETTKSLSDKVIDRGIIINFPRPTTLERRSELKPLTEEANLLKRKLWEGWWKKKSEFNENQILDFKEFIENMNESLAKVGRALGHRVWQSIEYYMANYPTVREAQLRGCEKKVKEEMKIAFEDQLVQKVMPKLRGIETRGKSQTDCLDKIKGQLVDNGYSIVEDFELACEFGHGQFIWNSANYIKDEITEVQNENSENTGENGEIDNQTAPNTEDESQEQKDKIRSTKLSLG